MESRKTVNLKKVFAPETYADLEDYYCAMEVDFVNVYK